MVTFPPSLSCFLALQFSSRLHWSGNKVKIKKTSPEAELCLKEKGKKEQNISIIATELLLTEWKGSKCACKVSSMTLHHCHHHQQQQYYYYGPSSTQPSPATVVIYFQATVTSTMNKSASSVHLTTTAALFKSFQTATKLAATRPQWHWTGREQNSNSVSAATNQ